MPTPLLLSEIRANTPPGEFGGVQSLELPAGGFLFYSPFADIGIPDVSPPIFADGCGSFGVSINNTSAPGVTFNLFIRPLNPITLLPFTPPAGGLQLQVAAAIPMTTRYISFGNNTNQRAAALSYVCFSLVTVNLSGTDSMQADFRIFGFSYFSRGFGVE